LIGSGEAMKDITWIVVIAFTVLAFVYLVGEQIILKKIRKQFKIVIHVNGTRGKSTVARYMDGIMREAGYRTFTKTTGTIPMVIHCDKTEERIKRLGRANIREQTKMMWKAHREHAEVLILECMAVDPLLQWHSENHIIHADINIITNIRHDHLAEMGSSLDDIICSLANTASSSTIVVSADTKNVKKLEEIITQKQAKFVYAEPVEMSNQSTMMQENISVAIKTAKLCNITTEIAQNGINHYLPDPGAYKQIKINDFVLINAFSANDPETTMMLFQDAMKQYPNNKITLLVNNRGDRPERTMQNIELIQQIKPQKVYIAGDNANYVYRKTKQYTNARYFKKLDDILQEEIVFAFGNIGNQGFQILQACEERRKQYGH
jgi:poly-gamma-glutamate synthase PgsB/CapB